jgi:L-ribulose-5-phosphate 3-epimerase
VSGAADRRRFIKSAGALAVLAVLRPRLAAAGGKSRKAIAYSALPAGLTPLGRLRLAADAGFSGVEMPSIESLSEVEDLRRAAERAGVRIHCVTDTLWQRHPLSSAHPVVVRQGVASIQTSLRNARLWGADAISIVPASGRDTSYREAWSRSQQVLYERVLPVARDSGVVLAIVKVWDGFLVGPSEVARYVDAFDSPWVKAAFDTANAPFYTHPADWIRTLGPRLANVRVGGLSVDLAEMRRALDEIGYEGWVTDYRW